MQSTIGTPAGLPNTVRPKSLGSTVMTGHALLLPQARFHGFFDWSGAWPLSNDPLIIIIFCANDGSKIAELKLN